MQLRVPYYRHIQFTLGYKQTVSIWAADIIGYDKVVEATTPKKNQSFSPHLTSDRVFDVTVLWVESKRQAGLDQNHHRSLSLSSHTN